ncbi:MAG: hypothetical protein HC858_03120 [Brachymonas sp.]|nr:hypothetical protein [Brachymonas sp.]
MSIARGKRRWRSDAFRHAIDQAVLECAYAALSACYMGRCPIPQQPIEVIEISSLL